jgi:Raf kinase inhibitor-like YbhB/YbcL family protein
VKRANLWGLVVALFAFGLAAPAWAFELSSSDVPANSTIPMKNVYKGFGCSGGNVSPALSWANPPADTKSFALTVYDPDAPTGSGFWHWVLFNIPAAVNSLPTGAGNPHGKHPKGAIEARNDYGDYAYGGPCPPPGDQPHHYIFTVYALKVDKLPLKRSTSDAVIGFMIHANQIDKATFTATYGR